MEVIAIFFGIIILIVVIYALYFVVDNYKHGKVHERLVAESEKKFNNSEGVSRVVKAANQHILNKELKIKQELRSTNLHNIETLYVSFYVEVNNSGLCFSGESVYYYKSQQKHEIEWLSHYQHTHITYDSLNLPCITTTDVYCLAKVLATKIENVSSDIKSMGSVSEPKYCFYITKQIDNPAYIPPQPRHYDHW